MSTTSWPKQKQIEKRTPTLSAYPLNHDEQLLAMMVQSLVAIAGKTMNGTILDTGGQIVKVAKQFVKEMKDNG
jgi:hypothetical protein